MIIVKTEVDILKVKNMIELIKTITIPNVIQSIGVYSLSFLNIKLIVTRKGANKLK